MVIVLIFIVHWHWIIHYYSTVKVFCFLMQLHQENSICLASLAPDAPDAPRLPYLVWQLEEVYIFTPIRYPPVSFFRVLLPIPTISIIHLWKSRQQNGEYMCAHIIDKI